MLSDIRDKRARKADNVDYSVFKALASYTNLDIVIGDNTSFDFGKGENARFVPGESKVVINADASVAQGFHEVLEGLTSEIYEEDFADEDDYYQALEEALEETIEGVVDHVVNSIELFEGEKDVNKLGKGDGSQNSRKWYERMESIKSLYEQAANGQFDDVSLNMVLSNNIRRDGACRQ